jgi:4-amino-4-deoxychorismate lyase
MILVNGQPEDKISILDRGLQYGDGLFETIAFRDGHPEFLQAHLSRLLNGCERLKISSTELKTQLDTEIQQVCDLLNHNAVIKVTITRGQGGRGYKALSGNTPTRIISTHDMPNYPKENSQGIKVRLCEQALSENINLAGIKHLNRLDQVLARSEWDDEDIAEGLMCNNQQQLIEGTMSNLFLVKNGKLLTPELKLSGVAGIMRQQVMVVAQQLDIEVIETVLTQQDLKNAEEVFITNSLIDIWPVIEIKGFSNYVYGNITQQFQNSIRNITR